MSDSENLLDLGRRPVLNPGEYGHDGEAILDRYALIDSRNREGTKADQFQVVVKTAEFGVVRLFADPPRMQGTQAIKWFQQLGVPDEVLRSMAPSGSDEDGATLKGLIEGKKVIVKVKVRQWTDKDTGEQHRANAITDLLAAS